VAEQPELTLSRLSSSAVREATGRGWEEWLAVLDEAGAVAWDHKVIVAHLERAHPELSGWWRQSITVGYEQGRGKRVVGETADTGFQIGVRRTVGASLDEVWDILVSRPELWLGHGVVFELDEPYAVAGPLEPAVGVVRVVRPRDRLRLTWQPEGWDAPATVQLTVSTPPSGRTTIGAHLEKLPDAKTREAMRTRWREALERVIRAARPRA
jgi:hypothetical protein